MTDHPATRDLTYEAAHPRVVWNSFKRRYYDRPCHGVIDPGAYQRAAFTATLARATGWLVGALVVGGILWRLWHG